MVAGMEAKWALPVGDEFNADLSGPWPLFWLTQGSEGWKSETPPRVGTHPGVWLPVAPPRSAPRPGNSRVRLVRAVDDGRARVPLAHHSTRRELFHVAQPPTFLSPPPISYPPPPTPSGCDPALAMLLAHISLFEFRPDAIREDFEPQFPYVPDGHHWGQAGEAGRIDESLPTDGWVYVKDEMLPPSLKSEETFGKGGWAVDEDGNNLLEDAADDEHLAERAKMRDLGRLGSPEAIAKLLQLPPGMDLPAPMKRGSSRASLPGGSPGGSPPSRRSGTGLAATPQKMF